MLFGLKDMFFPGKDIPPWGKNIFWAWPGSGRQALTHDKFVFWKYRVCARCAFSGPCQLRIYRLHPHSTTPSAKRKTAQENFSRTAALAVFKF